MHIITHEFEKIWCIIFKSRICDYLTPKTGNMRPYEANISKIINTCIKICHHHVNHHCCNLQIEFWISTVLQLCRCNSNTVGKMQNYMWTYGVEIKTFQNLPSRRFQRPCKIYYCLWKIFYFSTLSPSGAHCGLRRPEILIGDFEGTLMKGSR